MILHFYHKKTLLPKLLQWFSGGTKNHVSIQIGGIVYEAIGGRLGQGGVVMSPDKLTYHKMKKGYTLQSFKVQIKYQMQVRNFLNEQVGKGYDYRGIYGFLLRFIPHNKDKWYCSELAAEALKIGGYKINQTRLSPSALLDIIQNDKSGNSNFIGF